MKVKNRANGREIDVDYAHYDGVLREQGWEAVEPVVKKEAPKVVEEPVNENVGLTTLLTPAPKTKRKYTRKTK